MEILHVLLLHRLAVAKRAVDGHHHHGDVIEAGEVRNRVYLDGFDHDFRDAEHLRELRLDAERPCREDKTVIARIFCRNARERVDGSCRLLALRIEGQADADVRAADILWRESVRLLQRDLREAVGRVDVDALDEEVLRVVVRLEFHCVLRDEADALVELLHFLVAARTLLFVNSGAGRKEADVFRRVNLKERGFRIADGNGIPVAVLVRLHIRLGEVYGERERELAVLHDVIRRVIAVTLRRRERLDVVHLAVRHVFRIDGPFHDEAELARRRIKFRRRLPMRVKLRALAVLDGAHAFRIFRFNRVEVVLDLRLEGFRLVRILECRVAIRVHDLLTHMDMLVARTGGEDKMLFCVLLGTKE